MNSWMCVTIAMVPRPLVARAWRKEREGQCRECAEGREAPQALDSPMGTREEATTAVHQEENQETTHSFCHLGGRPSATGVCSDPPKAPGPQGLCGVVCQGAWAAGLGQGGGRDLSATPPTSVGRGFHGS